MGWKSTIATAVITGVVTVVTGLALFHLELREPKLTYALDQSIPFQGDQQTLSIQSATFRNEGAAEVKGVTIILSINGGVISQHKLLADPSMNPVEKVGTDSYRLDIPTLNPKEKVQVSLLTERSLDSPQSVRVSFRGEGVTGEPAADSERDRNKWTIGVALVAAYAGMSAAALMSRRYRKSIRKMVGLMVGKVPSIAVEQHHALGSLFAIHGDLVRAERYLGARTASTYWSESDLIAAEAIDSGNADFIRTCCSVLSDLIERQVRMSESSQAVVHVNIARLHLRLGESESAKLHLEKALAIDNDSVEFRKRSDDVLSAFS